ncbi:hypothetical protein V866_001138 [Kwoniella sp. B9012]
MTLSSSNPNDHDYGQNQNQHQVGENSAPNDISDFFSSDNFTSALDPSLFALAAQVQAVAHAQAQGIDIDFNIDPTFIDPIFPSHDNVDVGPIDPSLLEIAQVVEDVNKGKIKLDEPTPSTQPQQPLAQAQSQTHTVPEANTANGTPAEGEGIHLDVEIDPTLREIVNSLTNAQQSSHINGQSLSHAQAAAAIGAHLTDAEERERLQQSLQTTLEDLTQASFNSLFPPNFPQSPSNNFLNLAPDSSILNDPSQQAGPSTHEPTPVPSNGQHEEYGSKRGRGRGRPKGSKNKHKAVPIPKVPKGPKPPSKPKGRPPKERNPEEQAEYELRRHERAMGIKRRKGRPRKFPGYLVREMRLKKNRKEFNELLRNYQLNKPDGEDDSEDEEDDDDDDGGEYQGEAIQIQNLDQMRMMMDVDVENMTNGINQALQVHNDNDNNDHNDNINLGIHTHHQQQQPQQQQQHHRDDHDNVNVFGNWSVDQDGQSLLDVVNGVGGVNDHTMEGVFGLNH